MEEKNKKKNTASKTLKVVNFRNRFLYVFYRFSTLIFFCSLILTVFSASFFIYFLKKPIPPQYIPIDKENKLLPLPLVSENTKKDSEIIDFSVRAIKKLFTYDYINYPEQIQEASYFFSDVEWDNYLTSLTKSQILDFVKKGQIVSSVKISGAPSVYEQGLDKDIGNVFTWRIKIPVIISYFGKTGNIQEGEVHMTIRRVSVIQNPEGINIEQFVFQTKNESDKKDKTK